MKDSKDLMDNIVFGHNENMTNVYQSKVWKLLDEMIVVIYQGKKIHEKSSSSYNRVNVQESVICIHTSDCQDIKYEKNIGLIEIIEMISMFQDKNHLY